MFSSHSCFELFGIFASRVIDEFAVSSFMANYYSRGYEKATNRKKSACQWVKSSN